MYFYLMQGIDKDMMLKDINGREMKASDIFACCIEYIKNKVFVRVEEAVRGLTEEQIHWMITVPAIWNESARQFMREAATKVCLFSLFYQDIKKTIPFLFHTLLKKKKIRI